MFKVIKIISLVIIIALIIITLLITSVLTFDLLNTFFFKEEDAIYYKSNKIKNYKFNNKNLKIMTWNIKFGAARIDMFFDCHGKIEIFSKKESEINLNNLAKKINEINPDIIFLQEVDIDSDRSGNINQINYLLNKTNLNYGVYASQWKVDYLPKHNIGKINSGNAILSKYKIKNAKRFSLSLIESQDFITQYFYLKRNILKAEIFGNLVLLNTHFSAYVTDDTVKKQMIELESKISFYEKKGKSIIVGGDLNLIPSSSKKIDNFPDNICKGSFESYSFKNNLKLVDNLYKKYNSAIPLDDFDINNSKYFTHTTDKNIFWNRKIDYLFTNKIFLNGKVLQDTMKLSDHAPIVVNFFQNINDNPKIKSFNPK